MKYAEIREECLAANLLLPKTGLVDLTFGNVSVFDPNAGVFAIKPSGVAYDKLKAEELVIVDLDGDIVEGSLKPSSDTPTHRKLYASFGTRGVRSVVHTHSRNAVAFAQAGVEIPCLGTTHADYFHGAVPVTRMMAREEVAGDYEWETGVVIVECFANLDPLEMPAVLVRNHGPFVWNVSGAKAVECAQALEIVADIALKTLSLSPLAIEAPQYLVDKHFNRKHGSKAYYGQK
jgi:L-ribulose-5-phosphate 4-epimerase